MTGDQALLDGTVGYVLGAFCPSLCFDLVNVHLDFRLQVFDVFNLRERSGIDSSENAIYSKELGTGNTTNALSASLGTG